MLYEGLKNLLYFLSIAKWNVLGCYWAELLGARRSEHECLIQRKFNDEYLLRTHVTLFIPTLD